MKLHRHLNPTHTGFAILLLMSASLPCLAESPITLQAREFRVQAYQNFRSDRAKYNELRRLDDQLSKQWQEAGKPEAREAEVLAWYRAAGSQTAIPAVPDFSALIAERNAKKERSIFGTVSKKTVASVEPTTLPGNDETVEIKESSVTRSLTRAVIKAFTNRDL